MLIQAEVRKRWQTGDQWSCPACHSDNVAYEDEADELSCLCLDCQHEETSGKWTTPAEVRELRRQQREHGPDAEWWAEYHAHLQSNYWERIREQVRARCHNVCERCHRAPMFQAHHLTYVRMGHELLGDLTGLCLECHAFLHDW